MLGIFRHNRVWTSLFTFFYQDYYVKVGIVELSALCLHLMSPEWAGYDSDADR